MLTPARFRALAALTAASGYLQIVLGGLVRVSGSGLGCPDWPTCYGKPYPAADLHSIIEYSHRANGALFGLLVILTVLAALWLHRLRRTSVTSVAAVTLLAVVAEGLLGWQVVATLLAPVLVLIHLGLALLILGAMVAITVLAVPVPQTPDRAGAVGRPALAATAATYVMLLTGSSVVATHADDVCRAWPLCGSGLALTLTNPAVFDILHRGVVLLVSALLVFVLARAIRQAGCARAARPIAWATLTSLAAQIAVGAAVGITDQALFLALHVALATVVWAGIVAITVLFLRRPEVTDEPARHPSLEPAR